MSTSGNREQKNRRRVLDARHIFAMIKRKNRREQNGRNKRHNTRTNRKWVDSQHLERQRSHVPNTGERDNRLSNRGLQTNRGRDKKSKTLKKMAFKKGRVPWNKDLTKETNDTLKKVGEKTSRTLKKRYASGEISPWNKGKKCPQLSGKNNPMYGKKNSWGYHTKKAREAIRKSKLGKKRPAELIEKLRIASTDREKSKEERLKISERTRGENNPFYGKHHTKDAKIKNSIAHKGKNNAMFGRTGEKCPHWRGGISFLPYSPDFNSCLKRKIRKRDDHTCQMCDFIEEQLGYSPMVHHIDYCKTNNKESNLVSLCRSCHAKTGFNREHWTRFFQSLLSERYGYKYNEQGDVILGVGVVK